MLLSYGCNCCAAVVIVVVVVVVIVDAAIGQRIGRAKTTDRVRVRVTVEIGESYSFYR